MPIQGGTTTVTTTPVQIDGNFQGWTHIHIKNDDNTKTIFIGSSDVTPSNGLRFEGLETMDFDIPPNECFFVVTSSGTSTISWMKITH